MPHLIEIDLGLAQLGYEFGADVSDLAAQRGDLGHRLAAWPLSMPHNRAWRGARSGGDAQCVRPESSRGTALFVVVCLEQRPDVEPPFVAIDQFDHHCIDLSIDLYSRAEAVRG